MSGYKYVGKRIYYISLSGIIVLDTGEMEGWVCPNPHELLDPPITKKEYDFKIYSELQKYNPEEIDFIDLEYGEFKTEFSECTDYHINIETKQIVFEYGEKPPAPDIPVTPTLYEKVETLIQENEKKNEQIAALTKNNATLILSDAKNAKTIETMQSQNAKLILSDSTKSKEIASLKEKIAALESTQTI